MGDGGVHQYAVAAQFHGDRRVRGGADAGVDQDRHLEAVDDQAQVPRIDDAHAGADQRSERHDRDTADILQHLGLDRVVGAVHHHLEAVLDENLGGFQRFRHVREQIGRIAQHFELAQRVAIEEFAAKTQGTDRVIGGVTARGVRQDGEFRGR